MTARLTTGLLILLTLLPAAAQDRPQHDGYFEVRSASTTLANGVHELEARLQLVLSDAALDALNSGDRDSFATLYSALNNLGRIRGLPVLDDAVLQSDKRYRVRLRARLSTEQYPAPLRILFFWRDQWHLESEWFEWLLER
jgi:hypothetical protein